MEEQQKVTGHTRKVNGKNVRVRTHTRSAQWARTKSAWIGTGFSTLSAAAILVEAGVTLVSTISVILIALLTAVAVFAGGYAERNKKRMNQQRSRRTSGAARARQQARTRSSSRSSSSRSRTSSQRRRR